MYNLQVSAAFAVPVGLYRLLECVGCLPVACANTADVRISYLANESEGGPRTGTEKPWVWILWMLLGPIVVALMAQYYTYLGVSVGCRCICCLLTIYFRPDSHARAT